MKYRIAQIKTDIDTPTLKLPEIVAGKLGISESDIRDWKLLRKSIDSRKKPQKLSKNRRKKNSIL